jgi:hypothetical protein
MLEEEKRRKAAYNDRVHLVEFKPGNLLQVYISHRDGNYDTRNKLLPRWSPPRTIVEQIRNS